MIICAGNAASSDYTLCGMASDAHETDEDCAEFRFAGIGENVTCEECLRVIRDIHKSFTPTGKARGL